MLRVPLAHPLGERAAALVARVGGEPQAGVGLDARRGRPDPLELPHGLVQLGCGELRDPAPVALGEPGAAAAASSRSSSSRGSSGPS